MTDKINIIRLNGTASGQSLRQLLTYVATFSEQSFKNIGRIYPMFHAETEGGETLVVTPRIYDKDERALAIRALFAQEKVKRYVYLDEMWYLDLRGSPEALDIAKYAKQGLSDNPDRLEAVMVVGEDAKEMIFARRDIIRPKRGKAKLGDLQFDPEGGRAEGRMVGLLPRPAITPS